MKRAVPVAVVAALIAAAVLFILTSDRGEDPDDTAIIYPDVWQALETAESVNVYIAIRGPDEPIEDVSLAAWRRHARATQERVLAALGPDDFELVHANELFGLSGYVTESGLRILASHPDVRGVEIPSVGTWNLGSSVGAVAR